jgi:RNA polymerase sigma-70 factor (ECF subfamily)
MSWFTDYTKFSDEDLMHLIARNNTAGVKELYRRYNKKIYAFLYRMLGNDEDKAQDFLQEVFLRIVDKAGNFNPDQRFRNWVFSMASNLCKNEYRRLQVRQQTTNDPDIDEQPGDYNDPDAKIDQRDLQSAIFKELLKIDDEQRETFLLRFQQQYSIKEISEIQQCPDGTVKSRLHNTTRKLALKLKAYNPYIIEA